MLTSALIAAGCCLLAAGDAAAAPAPASTQAESYEIRDVLLMLDDGPLHLRLNITLGGRSLDAAREAFIDRLIESLDADGDGKLSRQEANRSPLLTTLSPAGRSAFLQSLQQNEIVDRNKIRQSVERVGGETVVYRQNNLSAENDREVFRFLDRDGSGLLEPEEMVAAGRRILERDADRDGTVSFQEFLPEPEQPETLAAVSFQPRPDRPAATISDVVRDAAEPLLPRRLLRKYDKNRDGKLTADELGWTAERIRLLDRDGDGMLDERELADIRRTPIDLEIAVDLAGAAEGESALTIVSHAGRRLDSQERPNFARLAVPGSVITLTFRDFDPVASAVDNAMRQFNLLDVDGNGYLDREETSQRIRFERGLFEAIDADGDGKIFGDEMERYVRLRAEPAALTCRVNIYDAGHGFFQALDRNGDGRISVREMRMAEESLNSLRRRGKRTLAPDEPPRHFHIEFVRGSYQLFGPAEHMLAPAAMFEQRAPVGPIWFQRMDRNNDGDLTWDEFLGPREVFNRLDLDGDGLIDPQEAERAGRD